MVIRDNKVQCISLLLFIMIIIIVCVLVPCNDYSYPVIILFAQAVSNKVNLLQYCTVGSALYLCSSREPISFTPLHLNDKYQYNTFYSTMFLKV